MKLLNEPQTAQSLVDNMLKGSSELAEVIGDLMFFVKDPDALKRVRTVAKDKTNNRHELAERVLFVIDRENPKPENKLKEADIKKLAAEVMTAKVGEEGDTGLPSEAENAASKLVHSGDPKAINALISIMRGKKADPAWVAALALGKSNNPRAIEALMQVLKNRKSLAYHPAVLSIDNMRSPIMVPYLVKLLNSDDKEVVVNAISGLGDIRDKRATRHLTALLSNPKYTTECCRSLAQIGDPAAIDAVVKLLGQKKPTHARDSEAFLAVMVSCGKNAVDHLLPLLENQSPAVRVVTAQAFQTIKESTSVEPLVKALDDTSPKVRADVVWALEFQRDDRAAKPLIPVLKDSDAWSEKVQ